MKHELDTRQRRQNIELVDVTHVPQAKDPPFEGILTIGEFEPIPLFKLIEQRAAVFQLVGRLPEDQRRVIVARFVEQKSIREIAHELHRSEGAVKQLQFRALEKLRTDMEAANG